MIKFTKMHGTGNDYVYINNINKEVEDVENLARYISNRHFGVGSDGLILICKSDIADFKMRMFNSNGSEAQMCGNGIRCVGKYVYDKGLTKKKIITIETLAGLKTLNLNIEKDKVKSVKVDMGEPILELDKIPVVTDKNEPIRIKALDKEFTCTCISMGNPHAVIIIDDVEKFNVKKYGKVLEINEIFPKKSNIEFIQTIDKEHIKMRVWERGTGETLACGTGACAALVACYLNNLTKNKATVELLGGNLQIEWDKENNHVYMTGPAVTVFEGKIEI